MGAHLVYAEISKMSNDEDIVTESSWERLCQMSPIMDEAQQKDLGMA
jgi:hypothetical protein